MKKIVAWSDSSGARFWRLQIPFNWINKEKEYKAYISQNAINDKEVQSADVIVLHNIVDKMGLSSILAEREISGYKKKIVVDVDDALFTDSSNPYAKKWDILDASFVLKQIIKEADVVTCTTKTLQEELEKYNKNTVILPNCFDPYWFDVRPSKNDSEMVRIGWTGAVSHYDDFVFIRPVLDEIMDIYPQVKMIICGDPRFPQMLKHKNRIEFVPSVDIEMYPMRLAGLALDIGIAPLVDKPFNYFKSPIKWMEYSLCKVPSICSEIVYGNYTKVTAATHEQWVRLLRKLIENKTYREKIADNEYRAVQQYNIKDNYKKWIEAYTKD